MHSGLLHTFCRYRPSLITIVSVLRLLSIMRFSSYEPLCSLSLASLTITDVSAAACKLKGYGSFSVLSKPVGNYGSDPGYNGVSHPSYTDDVSSLPSSSIARYQGGAYGPKSSVTSYRRRQIL
jgi:hypothetical protein